MGRSKRKTKGSRNGISREGESLSETSGVQRRKSRKRKLAKKKTHVQIVFCEFCEKKLHSLAAYAYHKNKKVCLNRIEAKKQKFNEEEKSHGLKTTFTEEELEAISLASLSESIEHEETPFQIPDRQLLHFRQLLKSNIEINCEVRFSCLTGYASQNLTNFKGIKEWQNGNDNLRLRPAFMSPADCSLFAGYDPPFFGVASSKDILEVSPLEAKTRRSHESTNKGPECNKDEVNANNDQPDIFLNCTKPVAALEFSPYTDLYGSYLAIGTAPRMHERHVFGEVCCLHEKSILQLWRISDESSRIVYGVELDGGSCIDLSWCPGDVAANGNHIGLLACIRSCGSLDIFYMPKPDVITEPRVFSCDAISVFHHTESLAAFTCVEWNRAYPHSTLIAGKTNATISVWLLDKAQFNSRFPHQNLSLSSSELVQNNHGTTAMASRNAICAISSCPSCKYLFASISIDCMLQIWDLRFTHGPIIETAAQTQGRPTSIAWPSSTDYLIYSDDTGVLRFITLADGISRTCKHHRGCILKLDINPRYHVPLCLSGGTDGVGLIWACPNAASHILEKGKHVRTRSLREWSRRRRKNSKSSYMEVMPFERLLLDAHSYKRAINGENPNTKPLVLFGANKVILPFRKCSPVVDSLHTFNKHKSSPRVIHISSVAWGTYYKENSLPSFRYEWIAFGTKGSLTRVRRVPIPIFSCQDQENAKTLYEEHH